MKTCTVKLFKDPDISIGETIVVAEDIARSKTAIRKAVNNKDNYKHTFCNASLCAEAGKHAWKIAEANYSGQNKRLFESGGTAIRVPVTYCARNFVLYID